MNTLANHIPLAEAKNKLSALIERVSRGEEFVITRHGMEIANLVPARQSNRTNISEAIARMRAGRKNRSATLAEITAWKNEGRP